MCTRMCRGKDLFSLFLFYFQVGNQTLENYKCGIITVSITAYGSDKCFGVFYRKILSVAWSVL